MRNGINFKPLSLHFHENDPHPFFKTTFAGLYGDLDFVEWSSRIFFKRPLHVFQDAHKRSFFFTQLLDFLDSFKTL